jgi:hypothetical protein
MEMKQGGQPSLSFAKYKKELEEFVSRIEREKRPQTMPRQAMALLDEAEEILRAELARLGVN